MPTEYDSPWKELLERFFDLVVELFFPKLHGEIDWSQGYESQETELRKILPEAAVGKRTADALIRAFSHPSSEAGGGHDPRYVHVEVQCQPQEDFPNRIDDYNSLFKLKLGHPVVSILILGDNDPKWKPGRYLFRCGEFEKRVSFPMVKLVRYRRRRRELEEHANPVALFVLAHLLALDTQVEDQARAEGKLRLLQRLAERKMEADQRYQFGRLIDWLVVLPADSQRQVWQRLRAQGEQVMPFMSYPEQIGFDKGLQKGLVEGIQVSLELKFGTEGLALMPFIREQQDLALLQKVLAAIKPARSLDEVRRVIPSHDPA
jgi:hypothetical protein